MVNSCAMYVKYKVEIESFRFWLTCHDWIHSVAAKNPREYVAKNLPPPLFWVGGNSTWCRLKNQLKQIDKKGDRIK